MKHLLVTLLALVLTPLSSLAEEELPWLTDYAEARALASQTGRPILLTFR